MSERLRQRERLIEIKGNKDCKIETERKTARTGCEKNTQTETQKETDRQRERGKAGAIGKTKQINKETIWPPWGSRSSLDEAGGGGGGGGGGGDGGGDGVSLRISACARVMSECNFPSSQIL